LTNRGKIFVGYARNMLDDMDFQISRIKGLNNTTQKIRIDAAPSLSVLLLPKSSPVTPTVKIRLFMLNRLTSTTPYLT
jgi:DNA-binding transcriptional LysR family regulator